MLKRIITILAVTVLSVTVSANVQAATLTVQKGDTLWDLSRANNISLESIQSWNQLHTDLIHPGDILNISPDKQHIVKQGDTLWDISMNNDITVSQLKEWNELHSDLIQPGLNLLIFNAINTKEQAMPAAQAQTDSAPAVPAASTSNTSAETSTPAAPAAPTSNTSAEKSTPAAPAASTSNTSAEKSTPAAPAAPTSNTSPEKSAPAAPAAPTEDTGSKEITVKATAYTASCEGCSGTTATGINLKANPETKVIAVDPSVIPLGSKVYVEGYGEAVAGDTGGAIKGNRIDIFIPSEHDAINFGVKQVKVTIQN
ncbi:LysM peptidoglycan-binding and 3D domain-containing protein [Neobacillus cucumis]|uniref:LysM peptidoglycan-binding and 3D domain-containing protein n=1 Tax=Neobacillus cucumis TaxID=1740721 RepID=UPI001965B607|nr:3D domain-containing protein [Neobacillus cucumis]MBM7653873.1 3D (Asp-Asp-Asp) domain-containing protein/LysM repeat protein [Neobacillus cucumis]